MLIERRWRVKNVSEVLRRGKREEMKEEIRERRELIGKMVGSLYPAVVREEIRRLEEGSKVVKEC